MYLDKFKKVYMGIFGILVLQLNMIGIMGISYIHNLEPEYWTKQIIYFDFAPGIIQVTFDNLMFFFNVISVLSIGLVVLAISDIFSKRFWEDFGGGKKEKTLKPF